MTFDPRYPFDPFKSYPIGQPMQEENNRLRQLIMALQMELEHRKRELEKAQKLPAPPPRPPEWQVQMQAYLRAVSDQVAALHRKVDEMVTFQKSRGRTIVLDKKTGKPRAPTSGMNASKRVAIAKSKKVRVTRKTRGAQRP